MFSTTQQQYIDDVVLQMYLQGYKYYVVHTNTNINDYSNNEWRDLTFYFSKNEIKASSQYKYQLTNSALKYSVRTSNASRNYSDERVIVTNQNASTITINDYEFISTNATNSQTMNVLAEIEYNNSNNIVYHMTMNDFYVIPVCLLIIFLFQWINRVFPQIRSEQKL